MGVHPVVRADIQEHAHAALEERREVVLRREDRVEVRLEGGVDGHVDRAVVPERWVDPEDLPDRRAVQVGLQHAAWSKGHAG